MMFRVIPRSAASIFHAAFRRRCAAVRYADAAFFFALFFMPRFRR